MNSGKKRCHLPAGIWPVISLAVMMLLGGMLSCSFGQETSHQLNPQFVDLLNGKAKIKYFRVGFPGDLFIANGKPIVGEVFYEGGIQEDSFWVRNCTNSPKYSGHILPGWIAGKAKTEYWTYREGDVALAPIDPTFEAPTQRRALEAIDFARKALGIGVVILPGTFVLESGNRFHADTLAGEKISGSFDVSSNGWPIRCTYSSSGVLDGKAVVDFDYAANASNYAHSCSVSVYGLGIKRQTLVYSVLDCELETVVLPPEGFSVDYMTNYGQIDLRMRNLTGSRVHRKNGVYLRKSNGAESLLELNRTESVAVKATDGRKKFLLLLLIAPTGLLLWFYGRTKAVL